MIYKVAVLSAMLAIMASQASAKCPNNCSGHGSCTEDDVCRCWLSWNGHDCAQRSCPVAEAWAQNSADPHAYAECSNRGTCDTASGECKCFSGFRGRACERSDCPNDCSGHGKCRMMQDWSSFQQDSTLSWDERAIQSCVCDGGFMGPDCSQRICPYGDDPLTVCQQGTTEQVQEISFSFKADLLNAAGGNGFRDVAYLVNDDYYLRFETTSGDAFVTKRVTGAFGTAGVNPASGATVQSDYTLIGGDAADANKRLEAALESLPNFAVRDVTVTASAVSRLATGLTYKYQVTFHHEDDNQNNYGAQNLLECPNPTWGCSHAGCRPLVRQPFLVSILNNDGNGAVNTVKTNVLTPGTTGADSFVTIAAESVLPSCPVGTSCVSQTNKALAAIHVITVSTVADGTKVYIKAIGNADATYSILTPAQYAVATYSATNAIPDKDEINTNGYTFVGTLTSANRDSFDISEIVPNTRLNFDTSLVAPGAAANAGAIILYSLPTCSVADITSSGDPFNNIDIENIECAGRGSCDRANGQCKCFEGYTGLACTEVTVLV